MKTYARVGSALPVWKRAQVKGLKESRLSIRGDEDQGLVSSEEVWTSPSNSPHRLVSRVLCLRRDLYKAVEGPHTDILSSRWTLGHYFHIEGVWLFSSPTRPNSIRVWPFCVCTLNHRRRAVEIFLQKPEELSKCSKLVISTLCQ